MQKHALPKFNKLKNICLNPCLPSDQNKALENCKQPLLATLPTNLSQQSKLTTYKNVNQVLKPMKEYTIRVDKAFQLFSKAQTMYKLRFQTIFLAVSIMQKTIHLSQRMESNQYFIVCCLYLAMKYEQIYPPRLKQLGMLAKCHIKKEIYEKNQCLILKQLNYNLVFQGINQILSQYIQNLSSTQTYFVFYLLEIALNNRIKLSAFSIKEIVISVIYILCSHSIIIEDNDQVDGIKFQKIQKCSKMIILCQTRFQSQFPTIHKKYRSDSLKYTSMRSLPTCQSLTKIINQKTIHQISTRKTLVKLQYLTIMEEIFKKERKNVNL